jgi:hypothetical protein
MAGLLFRKCECGRQFKILFTPNTRKQTYTCECQRKAEVNGTVSELYWCEPASFLKRDDWIRLPAWRIEDVE